MLKPIVVIVLACSILLNTCACTSKENRLLRDTTASKYKVGQVWTYNTRSDEQQSTLTIVKVESDSKLGVIVHTSVQGLHLKSPLMKGGYGDTIAHMPFTEEAINKSVVDLLHENAALPHYQDGYEEWRTAFEKGKAGVFTITVAEAVDGVEYGFNK